MPMRFDNREENRDEPMDISRFTGVAGHKGIKTLLKKVQSKSEQMLTLVHAEERLARGGVISDDDNAHANVEIVINRCSVDTHLSQEGLALLLPMLKAAIFADLEALESELNQQGFYLEGQPKPKAVVNVTHKVMQGSTCELMRDHKCDDLHTCKAGVHVEVTRIYPGELYDLADATVLGTNRSIRVKTNHLRVF